MDRFGSFWGRCGSLWIVLDRFGSFWVVPRFSNYQLSVHNVASQRNLQCKNPNLNKRNITSFQLRICNSCRSFLFIESLKFHGMVDSFDKISSTTCDANVFLIVYIPAW